MYTAPFSLCLLWSCKTEGEEGKDEAALAPPLLRIVVPSSLSSLSSSSPLAFEVEVTPAAPPPNIIKFASGFLTINSGSGPKSCAGSSSISSSSLSFPLFCFSSSSIVVIVASISSSSSSSNRKWFPIIYFFFYYFFSSFWKNGVFEKSIFFPTTKEKKTMLKT